MRGAVNAVFFAVLLLAAAGAKSPALAAAHDGNWSVLIITEKGDCDRAYRYGVQIVDGNLVYDGGVVNMTGRVNAAGAIRVSVSAGDAQANGSGRMTRTTGRGNWSGRSGSDACSGYWEAERR